MTLRDDLLERRLTPEEWVNQGKVRGKVKEVSKSTRYLRRAFLDAYAQANGRPIEEVIAGIESKSQLYDSANNLISYCLTQDYAIGTTAEYRSMIPGFFTDVFGKDFDRKIFEEHVQVIQSKVTISKAYFSRDSLVSLLKMASPKEKALMYVLSYGLRVSEALSRKMSDIEDKGEYAIIKLWATGQDRTKTRESRRQFVSKECLDIIKNYRSLLPEYQKDSEWVFPGEIRHSKACSRKSCGCRAGHLVYGPVRRAFKKLCKASGLEDTEREIFSPHGLRSFAEHQMRECGLSETYTKQIVGHDTETEENYKHWQAIEKAWVEKCLDKMVWLKPTEVLMKPNAEQQMQINALTASNLNLEKRVQFQNEQLQRVIHAMDLRGRLPELCAICGQTLEHNETICPHCHNKVQRLERFSLEDKTGDKP